MEACRRDDRQIVKCFTCPRERQGDESGWYFVDVPDRARAYGPARIFVCPRHYRHFAERERGRWIEIIDAPVPVPTLDGPVLAPAPAAAWPETTVSALGALEIGVVDTLASES
jgi:hypothetical protein